MQTAASVASVQLLIQPDRDPITRSGAEITMKPEGRGNTGGAIRTTADKTAYDELATTLQGGGGQD